MVAFAFFPLVSIRDVPHVGLYKLVNLEIFYHLRQCSNRQHLFYFTVSRRLGSSPWLPCKFYLNNQPKSDAHSRGFTELAPSTPLHALTRQRPVWLIVSIVRILVRVSPRIVLMSRFIRVRQAGAVTVQYGHDYLTRGGYNLHDEITVARCTQQWTWAPRYSYTR